MCVATEKVHFNAASSRPASHRALRGARRTSTAVALLKKSVLNLRIDFVEPPFRALVFLLIKLNLSL
jgi:hypothetical protein